MLGKLGRAYSVLREAWLVARVPPNDDIARELAALAKADANGRRGLAAYLGDYPARGRIDILQDWARHGESGEERLKYSNSLFADGCLRLRPGRQQGAVVVYLPGNMSGADFALGTVDHPHCLVEVVDSLGVGLACWDWALQGSRQNGCIYEGLGSLYSGEREYSRILPALGTSLWREMVHELQFALAQIRRCLGPQPKIYVVGWSMGAAFAYVAPLLGQDVDMTIAAGSCARYTDLVAEGKARRHGFYFYPLNGLRYFDLDDVVSELLAAGRRLKIVYGDSDGGCLSTSAAALRTLGRDRESLLEITVLPNHGHTFSHAIKEVVKEALGP